MCSAVNPQPTGWDGAGKTIRTEKACSSCVSEQTANPLTARIIESDSAARTASCSEEPIRNKRIRSLEIAFPNVRLGV